MEKYKDKYRIPTNRLQGYDYGSNGCYYVTICTKNRNHYFGNIVNHEMQLSEAGAIAENIWLDIPNHFSFVILDQYVIMPNHIHGILIFNKNDDDCRGDGRDAINRVFTVVVADCRDAINRVSTPKTGGITGVHNPMLHANLGRVMRWFKGRVSFECRSFVDFAWQERFYDRIIRDSNGLDNVRNYIFTNPQKWNDDEYYTV